jgi:hypothetical protein
MGKGKFQAPSPAKLAALSKIRAWWKACKCHGVCAELLDLEWEASQVN